MEGYRKGFYPDFIMRGEMERVRNERAEAEERCQQMESQLARLEKVLSYQGRVQALAQRLSQGLEAMDFQQRRELLRLLVDQVVYDDGRLTIKDRHPAGRASIASYTSWDGGRGETQEIGGFAPYLRKLLPLSHLIRVGKLIKNGYK